MRFTHIKHKQLLGWIFTLSLVTCLFWVPRACSPAPISQANINPVIVPPSEICTPIAADASPTAYNYTFGWGTNGAGNGQFNCPLQIAFNRTGYAFIADYSNNRIQIFSPTGQLVTKWGHNGGDGSSGSGNGEFYEPIGVAVNASDYVYVADFGNFRIQVFTPAGQFVTKWGSGGSLPGQFSNLNQIAINSTGHVFVADTSNNRVQVFTQTGQWVASWNKTNGGFGTGAGEFHVPVGIAVNASGYVYVADAGNNRIQVFTPAGQFVTKWGHNGGDGSSGSGLGEFNNPAGVAINASGYVFVADNSNHRVQIFTPTGQFVGVWGGPSSSTAWGQFSNPQGIAVNGTGWVYVVDSGNNRIQVFDSPPSLANVGITPAHPATIDDLTVSYQFNDMQRDAESGTEIYWYMNASIVPGFTNCRTVPAAITNASEQWYFTALATDGYLPSACVTSPVVTINTAPTASGLQVTPSYPKSTDTLVASYSYADAEGNGESGTAITWYRNGILQPAFQNSPSVPSAFLNKSDQWYCTVQPKDGLNFGVLQTSAVVTIANSPPTASSPQILPGTPKSTTALYASYTYADPDGDRESGTAIRWYCNNVPLATFNDQLVIPAALLNKSQQWNFTVTPRDGSAFGATIASQTVTIGNTAPAAQGATVAVDSAGNLILSYTYSDADNDPESGTQISWYKNGAHQTAFDGKMVVSTASLTGGDTWVANVRPSDGSDLGLLQASGPVVVPPRPSDVAPTIWHAGNVTCYTNQTGNTLSWTITGGTATGTTCVVYRDGTAVSWGPWTAGTPVTVSLDHLAPGTYNFTIVATDSFGRVAQDTVFVAVIAAQSASTTAPATAWTTTDSLLTVLVVMVGGVLAFAVLREISKGRPVRRGARSPTFPTASEVSEEQSVESPEYSAPPVAKKSARKAAKKAVT